MFRRRKKTKSDMTPLITPRFVEIDKGFYDLSFEEQRALLRGFLGSLSPNEEVRKNSQKEAKRPQNEG